MSSDEIEEENSEQLGLSGYQWEPEYTEQAGPGHLLEL